MFNRYSRSIPLLEGFEQGAHITIADVIEEASASSLIHCLKHQAELQSKLDEVIELLSSLKLLSERLFDSDQVRQLSLLSRFEQSSSAIGGTTAMLMRLFSAEVNTLFDAPEDSLVEKFSDDLRLLRKLEFGSKPLRLSWWGSAQRFPNRPASGISTEQRCMLDAEQEAFIEYLVAELDRISRAHNPLLSWITTALKKSVMSSKNYKFLDSEWIARIHMLSKDKSAVRWTVMGVVAQHMVDEEVIAANCFVHQKLNVVNQFEALVLQVTPRFISQLASLRSILAAKLGTVQEAKMRILAASLTGAFALMSMFTRLLVQHSHEQEG